jgi:phosphoglycolate phosphatase
LSYKAVIFDLDGTLIDTSPDLTNAMNHALRQFGLSEISVQDCKEMVGNGAKVFAELALGGKEIHLIEEIMLLMKHYYHDKCCEYSSLYEGILKTVQELRQRGIRLAVVTNKGQEEARRIVRHFFGSDTFEHVVGATSENALKPDSTSTLKVVREMGLKEENFLFVGDSDVDVVTAISTQIQPVGVTWGFRSREVLVKAGAEIIIDRAEQILDLVT